MAFVCHIKIGQSGILIVTVQALILEPELTLKSILFTAPCSHCYSIHTAVAVVFKLTVAFCFCPQLTLAVGFLIKRVIGPEALRQAEMIWIGSFS